MAGRLKPAFLCGMKPQNMQFRGQPNCTLPLLSNSLRYHLAAPASLYENVSYMLLDAEMLSKLLPKSPLLLLNSGLSVLICSSWDWSRDISEIIHWKKLLRISKTFSHLWCKCTKICQLDCSAAKSCHVRCWGLFDPASWCTCLSRWHHFLVKEKHKKNHQHAPTPNITASSLLALARGSAPV